MDDPLVEAIEALKAQGDWPDLRRALRDAIGADTWEAHEFYGPGRLGRALEWASRELEAGNRHPGLSVFRERLRRLSSG